MLLGGGQDLGLGLRILLACARLLGHDLETLFDRGQVSQHEVECELFQLCCGIRVGAEAAGDLQQDVCLAREGHALGAASGRRVFDPNLGGSCLGGLDRFGQPREPLVRDVDHAHPVGSATGGEGVEQRGLASPGRADDRNVYRHGRCRTS